MARKFLFLVGLGAGYVLGARAGREQYDKLVAQADRLWQSPRVARARKDVEAYARQQAPIIAERAKAAAEAAPGAIADGARKTADAARDVAGRTTVIARDVAGRTSVVAKDVAGRTTVIAGHAADAVHDLAEKATDAAQDLAEKAADTAGTVTARVKKATPLSVEAPDSSN